jgi:hypothetical protein
MGEVAQSWRADILETGGSDKSHTGILQKACRSVKPQDMCDEREKRDWRDMPEAQDTSSSGVSPVSPFPLFSLVLPVPQSPTLPQR